MVEGPAAYRRPCFRFGLQVPASTAGYEDAPVEMPGTIERLMVRLYPGPENALRIRPLILRRDEEIPIVKFIGKPYFDGDGDKWESWLREPVGPDDILRIRYDNVAAAIAYDFAVEIEIDYAGGLYPAALAPAGVR